MNLGALASSTVISVTQEDSLDRAISLMEEHKIHHIVVMEDDKAVGMISDRDLLTAVGWKLEQDRQLADEEHGTAGPRTVSEVMSHPVLCLSPDSEVHTAARIMADRKIHAFPLEKDGRVAGIVTSFDLLNAYMGESASDAAKELLSEPIRNHMHTDILSIGPEESLVTASHMLRDHGVQHLPVHSKGLLVGIISDRDLRRVCGEEIIEDEKAQAAGEYFLGMTNVEHVMTTSVTTIEESVSTREAIRSMVSMKIGCLPVVKDDFLVGITTTTDLLLRVAQADEQ